MRRLPVRYIKASILLGLAVCLLVAALYETGVFHQLDIGLASFLGKRFTPIPSRAVQYPLFILLAFGVVWAAIDIPRLSLKCVIAAGALLQTLTAVWVLNLYGIFFSPFASVTAVALGFLGAFLYSRGEAGSRKRLLTQVVGDRVSKKTFLALLDAAQPLNLEGERRKVTVVVCEIFNHDTLEAALSAPDYVALTNSFRSNASDFLVERGGFLDECDGESVRLVFGAPLTDERHATTACEAALALAERLDDVNRECLAIWKQTFDFRVGINSGEMVVAAYGSRRLGTLSVAGEPVEFARRLCRANLIYGSRVIIGSATFNLAESAVDVRPMELIHRFTEGAPEEIYELLAMKNVLSAEELERRDLFWKAVVYFREAHWDEAVTLFYGARGNNGGDGPVDFYLRRIEQVRGGMPALGWRPGSF
jgi:adenylate cyclase